MEQEGGGQQGAGFRAALSRAAQRRASRYAGALLIVAMAGLGLYQLLHPDPFSGRLHSQEWQAVILSNDRVYFGHLGVVGDRFYELSNVFYISEAPASDQGGAPSRRLQPLSAELQHPQDHMLISADKVVLVETLDQSSPVLKEILSLERH